MALDNRPLGNFAPNGQVKETRSRSLATYIVQ